jgi:hypothetical protein
MLAQDGKQVAVIPKETLALMSEIKASLFSILKKRIVANRVSSRRSSGNVLCPVGRS